MEVKAQKITPFLWFYGQVDEAVTYYTTIFPDSEVINMNRLPVEVPGRPGKVMMATFRICGMEFMILDGGPKFKFTHAVSFYVHCKGQEEVDHYWDALTADGGEPGQCGWLKDKYGLSWQIIPDALGQYLGGPDPVGSKRALDAMLKMNKIVIAELAAAYKGE